MGSKKTVNRKPQARRKAKPVSRNWGTWSKNVFDDPKDRLKAAIHALPDLLFVTDRRGVILDYHAPDRISLYRPPQEFMGRNVLDLLPPPSVKNVRKALREAVAQGYHSGATYSLPGPEGERWYELSIAAEGSMRTAAGRLVVIARDITERKRSEDALRESETSKRALADNLQTAMIYQIDSGPNGQQRRFTYISKGVERLHGVTPEEAAEDPQRIYGQVVEEDCALVVSQEIRALETMTPLNVQVRIRMPSGEIRWRVFTSNPRRLPNGHVVWDGIEYDITERKLMEELLKQSEAKYRQLHDTMRDAFCSADMKGDLQEFNAAFRDLTGYTSAELHRMNYRDLTPKRWRGSEAKILSEQVRVRGYSDVYEKEYVRKNGTLIPVELRTILIRNMNGEPAGMWASIRDISSRKEAEAALRQAHEELEQRVRARTEELEASRQALAQREFQFRQMAEHIEEAFWLIDAKTWKVLYVSPAVERILHQPVGQFNFDVSQWFAGIHPEDRDRVIEAFRRGMNTGVPGTVIYRVIWPDATIRWIENSGSLTRDSEGRALHATGVMRDITERRYLETQILNVCEDERQRVGRELHDSLRQSLAAIGYMADALSADLEGRAIPEAAEARRLQRLIGEAAEEARAIAADLLLADMKRGGLLAALQELASRTEELFKVSCRCTVLSDIPALDQHVSIQLYRIAQEAATNAAKHSKAAKIEIRLSKNREGLLLSVKDAGKGIPSKKRDGRGMGMDIMRYRAGIIGARLWIDSTRKKGTKVNCLLPRPPPPTKETKK